MPIYITISEAARQFSLSEGMLRTKRQRGQIPVSCFKRNSKRVLINKAVFEKWLRKQNEVKK